MSNWIRKQKRSQLKKELGTNKIRDYWHQQNLTLGQRLYEGMKKAKEDRRK